jgi:ElaB/YqjD/DUF883 family membrane-anchored ribosome-binding protein
MSTTNDEAAVGTDGKDALNSDFETLKRSFNQLRTDLTSLVGSALGAGKTSAHVVKDKAEAAVDGVKHQLHNLKDKGAESAEAIEQKISDHPLTSIVIAFGVGFMVARFLSRK